MKSNYASFWISSQRFKNLINRLLSSAYSEIICQATDTYRRLLVPTDFHITIFNNPNVFPNTYAFTTCLNGAFYSSFYEQNCDYKN